MSNSNKNSNYENNIDISYDYIEKSLKEVQDINNHTNTQIGVLIGFNFTFIRFFLNELPSSLIDGNLACYSCLILKLLAYSFSFASILFCFFALYQNIIYGIIKPDVLLKNCDRVSHWELKLAIMDTWQEKLEKCLELTESKKQLFNQAIALILVSGLMVVLDEFIAFIFYN